MCFGGRAIVVTHQISRLEMVTDLTKGWTREEVETETITVVRWLH